MLLALSQPELQELRLALDLHLKRLERELARTEDREYQRTLHQSYDRLDGIRRRLTNAQDASDLTVA